MLTDAKIESNYFDGLSHSKKISSKFGRMTPVMCLETYPGDEFNIKAEHFARLAPMINPVYGAIQSTIYYFYVPNRILWKEFPDWIIGNSESELPYVKFSDPITQINKSVLGHYLGLPLGIENPEEKFNALRVAGYVMIWDEHIRDQNIMSPKFVPLVAGDNSTPYGNYMKGDLFRMSWDYDYFTACLPFAQFGDDVNILDINNLDIIYENNNTTADSGIWRKAVTSNPNPEPEENLIISAGGTNRTQGAESGSILNYDPNGTLKVDVDGASVRQLRISIALQSFLERLARGGRRYIETLKSIWMVKSDDQSLQRPEFLGSQRNRYAISEVLATTGGEQPLGSYGGHGITADSGENIFYKCKEHGYIHAILVTSPEAGYFQGIPRDFSYNDYLDFALPNFAHIGMQAVLRKEVNVTGVADVNYNGIFGYNQQYAHLKYLNNTSVGEFCDSLVDFHTDRIFEGAASLNPEFMECNPDERIFAVQDGSDYVYSWIRFNINAKRTLPKFGEPMIMG